jgi:hypothetical protein
VSASKGAVRVAVGQDFGKRSNVWRIWTTRDEIYVAARSLAGEIKTSLHSSGLFRHAFTSQSTSQFVPDGDRAWFKWNEPATSPQGARLILEIVIPTDELTAPTAEPPATDKAKIVLLDPAPAGEMTVISSLITDPGVEVHRFPVPETNPPAALIAAWPLLTRGTLWVVGSHQLLDDGFRELIRQGHELAERHASRDATSGAHLRNWVWIHDHGSALSRYLDLAGDGLPPAGVAG